MHSSQKKQLFDEAANILQINDRGGYTIPTHGLYPFQWNWDSCLTAIGQAHISEARAWQEIGTLFAHQWEDGMVPHIIFHELDDGYFPGPDVWNTKQATPTSGITQPAVAGFAIKRLYDRSKDKALAKRHASELLEKIDRWHQWFYASRDPANTGLVALIHPWEAGRDNSIDWDDAFERVPTEGVTPYTRRDTQHADPSHRPTKAQYDRYLWLVEHFRSLDWNNSVLHNESPFQLVDPGFNAILIRSCADLAKLAEMLNAPDIAVRNTQLAARGLAALESLWSDQLGQYVCFDRAAGHAVESASIGGILPIFAAIPAQRAEDLVARLNQLSGHARYLVPSHDPSDSRFDAKRYWRGPVWLIVNYMITDGLRNAGHNEAAQKIESACLELIETGGFAEYYDPITGEACGGESFTWTAAMVLEFLERV